MYSQSLSRTKIVLPAFYVSLLYRYNSELAFVVPVVSFTHASNVDFETPSHARAVCNSHVLAELKSNNLKY